MPKVLIHYFTYFTIVKWDLWWDGIKFGFGPSNTDHSCVSRPRRSCPRSRCLHHRSRTKRCTFRHRSGTGRSCRSSPWWLQGWNTQQWEEPPARGPCLTQISEETEEHAAYVIHLTIKSHPGQPETWLSCCWDSTARGILGENKHSSL